MKLNLKVDLKRFRMNPDSRSASAAAILMGIAFFFRAMVYFAFVNLRDVGVGNLISDLILPLLFTGACMILVRAVRLELPIVYGCLGAGICVCILIACFDLGTVNMIVNYILILAGAFCLLVHCLGIWNTSVYAGLLFLAALVSRVIWFSWPELSKTASPAAWLFELATLCLYGAMVFLPLSVEKRKKTGKA